MDLRHISSLYSTLMEIGALPSPENLLSISLPSQTSPSHVLPHFLSLPIDSPPAQIGCSAYNSCTFCTLDPNCGWCSSPASSSGHCVGGTVFGSATIICSKWSYHGCAEEDAESYLRALLIGVVTSVGVILAVLFVLGFGFYRYRRWRHNSMRPEAISRDLLGPDEERPPPAVLTGGRLDFLDSDIESEDDSRLL